MIERLSEMPLPPAFDDEIVRITADTMKGRRTDRRWDAAYDAGTQTYVVSGKGIERLVAMTQLQNEDAVNRLQRTLEKTGIINKLRTLGAKQGDTVRIGKAVFDFFDEYALDKPEDEAASEAV